LTSIIVNRKTTLLVCLGLTGLLSLRSDSYEKKEDYETRSISPKKNIGQNGLVSIREDGLIDVYGNFHISNTQLKLPFF
jgi:hypothetical protein